MSSEVDPLTGESISFPKPRHSRVLWNNGVFHFLTSFRLDRTIYPFTLKGEKYLNSRWKRALDIGIGITGSALSLPIIALGIGGILIEDVITRQPFQNPFYTRERFGFGNKKFRMHKFRSQVVDTSEDGITARTKVGRFLAETSLDEVPQFWDVTRGVMAGMGRRPPLQVDYDKAWTSSVEETPYHRALKGVGITEEEWLRGVDPETEQRVVDWANGVKQFTLQTYWDFVANDRGKPGLTSLYGVLGRKDVPTFYRILLDEVYERREASLGLDLALIPATIWAIIRRKGAR